MINPNTLTRNQLCAMFDHTNLKPYADHEAFEQLCLEARENGYAMVAINSAPVAECKALLQGSSVHFGAAISFPLGQTTIETKCAETENAIRCGADEIDYVVNLSAVKNGDWDYVAREMRTLVKLCRENGVLIKVIFETCYLTEAEITILAQIARRERPDFVKTSTGFGTAGATAHNVALMKRIVGDEVKVKAAGGIRTWEQCRQMILAGAERIGTSCAARILEGFDADRGKSG